MTAAGAHRRRLVLVFGLTLSALLVEVVGALASGSLALLADARHLFTDTAGIGPALGAMWVASRPATDSRTFGFLRLGDFDIEHSTFQLETADRRRLEEAYHA